MEYRIDRNQLFQRLGMWDSFLRRKVHLIACGGTALTLLGVKFSTKDVDLLVPVEKEYRYLVKTLSQIGYRQVTGAGWKRDDIYIFDLFPGNKIHTTELLQSPLEKDNHFLIKEFAHIYIGALNYYDLLISKLFRGTTVDMDDCISLIKAKRKEIDLDKLKKRYNETASYDISETKVQRNLEVFFELMAEEGIWNE